MRKTLQNIIAGTALAGSLAFGAAAQETDVEKQPEGNINHISLFQDAGLNTQTSLNYRLNDDLNTRITTLTESLPNGDANFGLDFSNTDLRLNLGYGDVALGEDLARALATGYFDNGFIGAKYQDVGRDVFSVHAGIGTAKDSPLTLEGTLGTEGASGVLFFNLDNATAGFGGGVSDIGAADWNVFYGNEKFLAYARAGDDMPLDTRVFIGDLNPKQTRYMFSATGSGNNERDDFFADQTFKFGIGNANPRTKLDYFDAHGAWLGEEPGSVALNLRLQEGNRAIAELGFRPNEYMALLGGIRAELEPGTYNVDNVGLMGQVNLDVGKVIGLPDGALRTYLNGWVDREGEVEGALGIGGRIEF